MSYYMTNIISAWDVITDRGNPTHSFDINALIKGLKKREVHGIGVKGRVVRPTEEGEWEDMTKRLRVVMGMILIENFDA